MEKENKKIGVSQKAIISNNKGDILIIRRSKTAPSRPLNWDLPGGEIDFGEDIKKSISREIKEETGLKIANPEVIDVISGFDSKKEFWITICYLVKTAMQKITLSYEHDDFHWIKPEEFQRFKASPRNKKFVKNFINRK